MGMSKRILLRIELCLALIKLQMMTNQISIYMDDEGYHAVPF